jgi:biofilm PGA synthesis N-glycosyltransferase PgaC
MSISIGVCVFNEEKIIEKLLNSLLNQKNNNEILEIIVVSSGCSDKTNEIVESVFIKSNPKIILLTQKEREGKASAINLFLKHARGEIAVLESGDTVPAEDTIENLTEPFKNPEVGMTGAHPIPVNNPETFIGFTIHLTWKMHNKLGRLGELVAFRRDLIKEIPFDTAVDEAYIEALLDEQGYKLQIVHSAIVYNKGSETVADFLKQRRRIFCGHLYLRKERGYAPPSMNLRILGFVFDDLTWSPRSIVWTLGAIFLEGFGRLLGYYDFYIKKNKHYIWNIAESTKKLNSEN